MQSVGWGEHANLNNPVFRVFRLLGFLSFHTRRVHPNLRGWCAMGLAPLILYFGGIIRWWQKRQVRRMS